MNPQYSDGVEILMKGERTSMIMNKLFACLLLQMIWCIILMISSNRIGVTQFMKLVTIYSFVSSFFTTSTKLSPFIWSIEIFVWDGFLAVSVTNTQKKLWLLHYHFWIVTQRTGMKHGFCILYQRVDVSIILILFCFLFTWKLE